MDQQKALPLRSAYPFGEANGLANEVAAIRNRVIEWDLSFTSSLRRGYVVALFQEHGLLEKFMAEHWPFGTTAQGESKRRWYLSVRQRYEEFLANRVADEGNVEEEVAEDTEEGSSFAAEADLRDFLAKNPNCIEPGLTLYRDEARSGVEFTIEDGRIDILAVDRDKRFVVIELKVGRGRNRTIGQLLYYMGWVDRNLANGRPCRGMIIAKEIPEDLVLAVERVPGVTLCKYNLSVTVETVASKQ